MGSDNPIGADDQQETQKGILRDCTQGATTKWRRYSPILMAT